MMPTGNRMLLHSLLSRTLVATGMVYDEHSSSRDALLLQLVSGIEFTATWLPWAASEHHIMADELPEERPQRIQSMARLPAHLAQACFGELYQSASV